MSESKIVLVISPSILTANFSRIKEEIASLQTADWLHLDVMDGKFVKKDTRENMQKALLANQQLNKLPLDVHLMVQDPRNYLETYQPAHIITFHVEVGQTQETIDLIKSKNIKVGLALNPKTPLEKILPFLSWVDMILFMTVEPGLGGQEFIEEVLIKILKLKAVLGEQKLNLDIQVDGSINLKTAKWVKQAGVNVLVVGTFLLHHSDRSAIIKQLRYI